MDVNKVKILQSPGDKTILIPIGNQNDLLNREDAIVQEENRIIEEIIGTPINYELSRYSNAPDNLGYTQLVYNFFFTNSPSTPAEPSYLTEFTENQIRYKTNQFANSFFKLDFYDTPDPKKQKNFFTIILPATKSAEVFETFCEAHVITVQESGRIEYTNCCGDVVIQTVNVPLNQNSASISICRTIGTIATYSYSIVRDEDFLSYTIDLDFSGFEDSPRYSLQSLGECLCNSLITSSLNAIPNLLEPSFVLDHTRLKEGFYIYWYENSEIVDTNIFHMSAKFFNATNGQYTKFIINDQSTYPNPYRIPNNDFYHRLVFNYSTKTYTIYGGQSPNNSPANILNNVVWFEYVNPPV